MILTKVTPFGDRGNLGSFDTFFDQKKYGDRQQAIDANDYVVVNFAQDERGSMYVEGYHVQQPTKKAIYQLKFPMKPGVNLTDEAAAVSLGVSLLL